MRLITREDLASAIEGASRLIASPVDIILVGGAAVLVWCKDGTATKDIDAMSTDGLDAFEDALRSWSASRGQAALAIDRRADPFEVYYPEDWRDRIVLAESVSTDRLRVHVPRPEDLAVAKIFRFAAKDAEDILKLSTVADFDPDLFQAGFVNVLPVSIGNQRDHAISFVIAWNRLYPDRKLEVDEIWKRAGLH